MPAVRDAARMLWTRLVGLSVCREQFVACYFVILLAATVNRVQNVTVSRRHLLMYDRQTCTVFGTDVTHQQQDGTQLFTIWVSYFVNGLIHVHLKNSR